MVVAWLEAWAANRVVIRYQAVVRAKITLKANVVTDANPVTSIWIRKISLAVRLVSVTAIRPSADRLLVTPGD